MLANKAPRDLGPTFWRMLLSRYNDFIRVYARANQTPPTIDRFFEALLEATRRASNPRVQRALNMVWEARFFALEYGGTRVGQLREMDPAFSTLAAVARAWRLRLGDVPMELLVDRYGPFTEDVQNLVLASVQIPLSIGDRVLPAVDLRAINQAASHTDARIQVADILAGVGREVAALAYSGHFDNELQVVVSDMLDLQGMWSDGSPLDVLYDHRPPAYASGAERR